SLSNQQYTNPPGAIAGMMFGGTMTGGNSQSPQPNDVFVKMNSKGSASDAMFASNPYATTASGIDVTQNYAFELFNTFTMWWGTSGPTNKRAYYGDITFTFSRPVSDPVIHVG